MIRKQLLSLASGLLLTCVAALAQATTTNLVSETTFDAAAGSPWSYGYLYGNNGLGAYLVNRSYYLPDDVDMTNGLFQLTFDITDLNGANAFGVGAGAPLFRADTDPALFSSGDRADYIFTFDARAEGLAAGQTAANGEMQVQFWNKDDAGQDVLTLQVNLPFQPTVEWNTFTFKLDAGSLGSGTADSDFELNHASTTDFRFAANFHEPFNAFGYDADNAVYFDNVKLQVINHATTGPVPTRAETIVDWNMDDKGTWYSYPYDWTANDNHATFTGSNNANGAEPNTAGVDGSSAWILNMDNTSLADNTPGYAGGGTGGGGPVDFTRFNTNDLASYRVSFDARVEGLADGRENTSAVLQLLLETPDDTIQPADADADPDSLVRLDFPITKLTPTFQHYSFSLAKGGVGGGSKENFAAYFDKISGLRTQWQIENAVSVADWGFDADNLLAIDNIKIERVYEGLAPLTFSQEGNKLVLNWIDASTGTTKLQSATTVDGQFSDVVTTGATYRADMTGPEKYFRLVWEAPVTAP